MSDAYEEPLPQQRDQAPQNAFKGNDESDGESDNSDGSWENVDSRTTFPDQPSSELASVDDPFTLLSLNSTTTNSPTTSFRTISTTSGSSSPTFSDYSEISGLGDEQRPDQ